mmetsp:Transcript_35775/g.91340  ORF Transcript_35775/g.91340 Transcript_35775/m.91340 type:complete len:333 (+) Transcript_35775:101-1099(+)
MGGTAVALLHRPHISLSTNHQLAMPLRIGVHYCCCPPVSIMGHLNAPRTTSFENRDAVQKQLDCGISSSNIPWWCCCCCLRPWPAAPRAFLSRAFKDFPRRERRRTPPSRLQLPVAAAPHSAQACCMGNRPSAMDTRMYSRTRLAIAAVKMTTEAVSAHTAVARARPALATPAPSCWELSAVVVLPHVDRRPQVKSCRSGCCCCGSHGPSSGHWDSGLRPSRLEGARAGALTGRPCEKWLPAELMCGYWSASSAGTTRDTASAALQKSSSSAAVVSGSASMRRPDAPHVAQMAAEKAAHVAPRMHSTPQRSGCRMSQVCSLPAARLRLASEW